MIMIRNFIIKQKKILMYLNLSKNMNNIKFIHTSAVMLSSVSSNISNSSVRLTKDQYQKMVEGIEELKALSAENFDTKLTPEAVNRMRERAKEIGLNIDRKEILSRYEEIQEVLNKNFDTPREFTSLVPPYLNKLLNNTGRPEGGEGENLNLSADEQSSVTNAVEAFSKALRNCEKAGMSEDCFKQLPITDILNKLISLEKNSSLSKNEMSNNAEDIIKNIWDKRIGEITLSEIYYLGKELSTDLSLDKISIEPHLAGMLISYGLAARVFNRYVNNQPLPAHLSLDEKANIHRFRNIYRVYFLAVFVPIMIITLNRIKPSLFKVVYNPSETLQTNLSNLSSPTGPEGVGQSTAPASKGWGGSDTEKNSILGFFLSYYKKFNKWIIRLLIFIIFILFYINGGFKFISEGMIDLILKYKLEIKCLLQLFLIFPIVLSIITLYLMMTAKIKGDITISNKYPNFVHKIINQISYISKKDVLYNVYRKMIINWTLVYLFLLVIVIII